MLSKISRQKVRVLKDRIAGNSMLVITLLSLLIALVIGISLYYKSAPILHQNNLWTLLTNETWKPFRGQFGFYPFIMGTLWVTGIAILIAFPLSLLTAIYLSEYANPLWRKMIEPILDILSGIPPVVYGVWGILAVVPFISNHIASHFVEFSTGYCVLAGGVVLAIMIIPLLISLFNEIFRSIPKELREASLSLGATEWQTTKYVLLRKSVPGIIAAAVLAISRAFGETIAVLMVCGNIPIAPKSVFDSAYPLPALIANNYGEMMSMPNYESALMLAALILFLIILLFNSISRIVLIRIEKRFHL
jgi:phosphate transport system permease protein